MGQTDKPTNHSQGYTEEIVQLVTKLRSWGHDTVTETYRLLAEQISFELLEQTDFDPARAILEAHRQGSLQLGQALSEALDLLGNLETAVRRREKYSSLWWDQTMPALESAFSADPEAATRLWMATYVESLLDWELPASQRLAAVSHPFPRSLLPYVLQIRLGDQAIQSGDYSQAVPMLENLLEHISGLSEPERRLQAALLAVFIGRIYQYQNQDDEKAAQFFQRAVDLAPRDGRPLAAQAILALKDGESAWGQVNQLLSQAIELSPGEPETYIGKALLAEARNQWGEADSWYQKAIQSALDEPDLLTALGKLLAPGSGRLYLQAARHLVQAGDLDSALLAVTQAQDLPFEDATTYPLRIAQALEADIRLALAGEQPEDAEKIKIAGLYFEAAKRYYWSTEYLQSIDLFRKAEELDPTRAEIFFYHADALRVANYKLAPPYYESDERAWESLETWSKGMALSQGLSKDEAWVYLVRADIEDMLARLPSQVLGTHRWQALLACERGLMVSASTSALWSKLSNELNHQYLYENAKIAIRRALDLDKNNLENLIELLSLLINTGDFTQAGQVYQQVEAHSALTDANRLYYSSWLSMIQLYQGKYTEALENIQRALDQNPDDLWLISLRGDILRRKGDLIEARQSSEWIWNNRLNPPNLPNSSEIAWAAYHLGDFYDAKERITPRLQMASERQNAHQLISYCYLGLGDLEQANDHFQKALELVNDARTLIDISHDLNFVEARALRENWPNAQQVIAWINQPGGPKDLVQAKRQELESKITSPLKEYADVLQDPVLGQAGSDSWLCAQAGLGRLNLENGELAAARDAYLALQPYADQFREVKLGLHQVGAAWLERASAQLRRQEYAQAELSLHALRSEPRLLVESDDLAELESLQFLVDLGLGQVEAAKDSLLRALGLFRQAHPRSAAGKLAAALKANLFNLEAYWQVEALLPDLPVPSGEQAEVKQVHDLLGAYVEETLGINQTGSKVKYPVVAPIAVEVGDLFVPTVPDAEWPVLTTYIPEMRDRVLSQMGITLPGVRFRGTNWQEQYAHYFQILLDESTVGVAYVAPGRWFLYTPHGTSPAVERLLSQAAGSSGVETVTWPVPGSWISVQLGEQLQKEFGNLQEKYGIELWQDPAQYMIRYLESVLRRYLTVFLGYQEMIDLLEPLKQYPADAHLVESVLPDRYAYVRLWRLLRRLLDEQVSIAPLKQILTTLQEHGLIHDDVHADLMEVRQQIKPYLPGNLPGHRTLSVDPALEEILLPWLEEQDGKRFLAVPADDARTFIDEMNAWKAKHDPDPDSEAVLIVQNPALRPFFYKIIRQIPTRHLVIAEAELLSPGNSQKPAP